MKLSIMLLASDSSGLCIRAVVKTELCDARMIILSGRLLPLIVLVRSHLAALRIMSYALCYLDLILSIIIIAWKFL